jgi:hypothetical protein
VFLKLSFIRLRNKFMFLKKNHFINKTRQQTHTYFPLFNSLNRATTSSNHSENQAKPHKNNAIGKATQFSIILYSLFH